MNARGFSLLEVKVSCAIIAIMLSVATPYWTSIQDSTALKSEIRVLLGNLHKAKITAIKQNCHVVFLVLNNGYEIFEDNGAGGGTAKDWVRQPNEKLIIRHVYQKGVELEKTTFPSKRTRFNGKSHLTGGRVILRSKKGMRSQLVVNIIGRFRIENI